MLGHNIKAERERCGLTQQQLAEKLGYDRSTVAKWENGSKEPLAIVMKNIAEIFNVSIETLYQ